MTGLVSRFGLALITAILLVAPGPAQALCVTTGAPSISTSSTMLPDYDPFSTSDTTLDVTITMSVPLLALCQGALSFTRTAGLPAVMSQGSSSLQYSVETTSGQTLMQTTGFVSGSSPAPANRLGITLPVVGSTTVTVRIRVAAGQLVAAGSYSDLRLNLTVVALGNLVGSSPTALLKEQSFAPAINVVSKCILPAPNTTTLDFSSAISNGHADPSVVQSAIFNNVQCTAPSILRLSGSAMQPVGSIPAQPGFDNFIDWQAAGTFGNASTTLNTNSASQASSATKNTASGATSNGTINVNVNLLNGNPIIAGSYKNTLTVTIDPNL